MQLLICALFITCLSQVLEARNSQSNIVLSGGSGGCQGGNGAVVMQNGRKGKKNEKLIIKDDALVMQDGEADGNLIMDGNNLIFKEGKKNENIIIKGGGNGNFCPVHHMKEEHVPHPIAVHLDSAPAHTQNYPTYVPIPVHFKKKVVHHHTKEVHHHRDQLGSSSPRRKDATANHNDTWSIASSADDEAFASNEQQPERPKEENKSSLKRKLKRKKARIRKLEIGDELSSKEKEHFKLKRVDRRLGRLGRFRLAGKMMKHIRWRKNAQKTNSKGDEKSREENNQHESTTEDASNGSQDNGEQQYEEDDGDDGTKDAEDEPSSSNLNLYEDLNTNVLYPAAVNPISSTGYMTSNFNNMMDLYPPPLPPSPLVVPAALSASDRRDLRKKYVESKKSKIKIEKLKYLSDHMNEDQIKTTSPQETSPYDDSSSEEVDNNDDSRSKDDSNLATSRSTESSTKSINHFIETTTSATATNQLAMQPIFAPDKQLTNQLTPTLYSLLAMASNTQQRLSLPPNHHSHSSSITTLPLFAPTKSNLESSAALLLPLIAHQSRQQQQLIHAQQQKLFVQEIKQKVLAKKLQQAIVARDAKQHKEKANYYRDEYKAAKSAHLDDDADFNDSTIKQRSKLMDSSEPDYWHGRKAKKATYHDDEGDDEYDKASINRLRRRRSDAKHRRLDQSRNLNKNFIKKDKKQDQYYAALARMKANDEFHFSDFNSDSRLVKANKLKAKKPEQTFAKRMLTTDTDDDKTPLAVLLTDTAFSATDNHVTSNHTL